MAEEGFKIGDFQPGTTKIFLKEPKALFHFEDRRQAALPRIATIVQRMMRGWLARLKVNRIKAAMLIQAHYRGYFFRGKYEEQKKAFLLQQAFRAYKAKVFLQEVRQQLDLNAQPNYHHVDKWAKPSPSLTKGSALLHRSYKTWRATTYIKSLSKERTTALNRKLVAYDLFKGQKDKKWE